MMHSYFIPVVYMYVCNFGLFACMYNMYGWIFPLGTR